MQKTERKKWKWSLGLVLAVVIGLAMPVGAQAAEGDRGVQGEISKASASGTLGKKKGIRWNYDASDKTLTVTGEDERDYTEAQYVYDSWFAPICKEYDVEKIVFVDCKITGYSNGEYLFSHLDKVKEIDASGLDTSAVTRMNEMFDGCISLLKLNLSGFNTGAVTNMGGMFRNCCSLTELDLKDFDTNAVTAMYSM